jgi:hypothetical protein
MRAFTNDEIIDRVEWLGPERGFTGWEKGIYEICIRSAADKFDAFDDKFYTFKVKADGERPEFIMVRPGTTNAGSYGLKHFDQYNHLGCAVLKSDWMVMGSHAFGYHKHIKNAEHEAYVQVKSWPHFRDNNRNERAEEIGPEYDGIIGANDHRAGINSTVIKNWSTACLVTAILAMFLKWLGFMKSEGKPPLNVAILKEWPAGATSTVSETPTPSIPVRDLKIGDEGDDVKELQAALKITADGIFGRGTRAAVIKYQADRDMRPDGIVGKNTRHELGI